MHHPQIVVVERESRLALLLRPLAEAERWLLREPRQDDVAWRLLQQPGPTVLVVRPGQPPERDLALIERVSRQCPDVATVAVGEVDDPPAVAGLAWDVGADFALYPPLSRDLLADVVAGLMRRTIDRVFPAGAAP